MNAQIRINEKFYPIRDINSFNLNDFNELTKILQSKNELIIQIDLLRLFIPKLPESLLLMIKDPFIVRFEEIIKVNKEIDLTENILNLPIIKFSKLKVGRFIDLEYFITHDVEERLESIVALSLLPEEFNEEDFDILKIKIREELNLKTILGIYETVNEYRKNLYSDFEGLFNKVEVSDEDEEDSEDPTPEENLGMLYYVYFLAESFLNVEKILEKEMIPMLNYLTWKKTELDKQKASLKTNRQKL